METGESVEKSLAGLAFVQALFTLVVGVLFTLMLLFGQPVDGD